MKKKIAALAVAGVLAIGALAACSSEEAVEDGSAGGEMTEQAAGEEATVSDENTGADFAADGVIDPDVTEDQALDIALADADVAKDAATDVEVTYNAEAEDGGTPTYTVKFKADGQDHEYKIDAVTGEIMK